MAHIQPLTDDQMMAKSKAAVDGFETHYGRPSHIFRAMSSNPVFLDAAWYAWKHIVTEETRLKRQVKEIIVVITAAVQKAEYCYQGHSHSAQREGLDAELVKDIMAQDFSKFNDPERTIFEFANKAALAPKILESDDYDELRELGLDEEEILEILSVVWVNTAMNNVVDAMGMKRTPKQMKELEKNLEKS